MTNDQAELRHFNCLTPAEDERLALLLEECGEVIQIIGKIQRHGYESVNPTVPNSEKQTNRSMLEEELGHVRHAIARLVSAEDVQESDIGHFEEEKAAKVERWLHHQPQPQPAPPSEPARRPRRMMGNKKYKFKPGHSNHSVEHYEVHGHCADNACQPVPEAPTTERRSDDE